MRRPAAPPRLLIWVCFFFEPPPPPDKTNKQTKIRKCVFLRPPPQPNKKEYRSEFAFGFLLTQPTKKGYPQTHAQMYCFCVLSRGDGALKATMLKFLLSHSLCVSSFHSGPVDKGLSATGLSLQAHESTLGSGYPTVTSALHRATST